MPGHLAVYNLQVTAWKGASGPISFACSGAPAGAICGVSANSTTLNCTTPIALTVTAQTSGAKTAASIIPSTPSNGGPWGAALMITALLSGMITLKNRKVQARLSAACVTILLVFSLCSCGGSNGGETPISTPPGTYTVTVTATAGNVIKTVPLTLNVRWN